MNVYVPATADGLHPSVVRSILRQGYAATVVPMLEVESYYWWMRAQWDADEPADLCIVEHDIELTGAAIALGPELPMCMGELEAFDTCPELWCAHSYEVYAGDVATVYGGPFSLGCCRFRRELLIELPDAVEVAGGDNQHPVHPDRSYAVMDSTLTGYLRRAGYKAHLHEPAVVHHHAYIREGAFWPAAAYHREP